LPDKPTINCALVAVLAIAVQADAGDQPHPIMAGLVTRRGRARPPNGRRLMRGALIINRDQRSRLASSKYLPICTRYGYSAHGQLERITGVPGPGPQALQGGVSTAIEKSGWAAW